MIHNASVINSENGPTLVWGVVLVTVLLGSLFAQRLPLATVVKQALAWVAIFAVLYGVFLFRDDFKTLWARAKSDVTGQSVEAAETGNIVRIRRADDGHFWVNASILGHESRFLIDSGATDTVLTLETARENGLVEHRGPSPQRVGTANGTTNSWPAGSHVVRVENHRVEDVRMAISEGGLDTNLLGMSFLNRLNGWAVEGNELVLKLP